MSHILVPGINIDRIGFDAIVRHLRYRMASCEIAILNNHVIGISIIDAAIPLEIVDIAIPSRQILEMADSRLGIVIRPFCLQLGGRALPSHLTGDYIFLGNRISVSILRLIGIHHMTNIHLTESLYITGGLVIVEPIRFHYRRIFRRNPVICLGLFLLLRDLLFLVYVFFGLLLVAIGRTKNPIIDRQEHLVLFLFQRQCHTNRWRGEQFTFCRICRCRRRPKGSGDER